MPRKDVDYIPVVGRSLGDGIVQGGKCLIGGSSAVRISATPGVDVKTIPDAIDVIEDV